VANRPVLDALIAGRFAAFTAEQLRAMLKQARIAYASVNSVADLSVHSQSRRVTVDTPTGPVSLPAPPAVWRDGQPTSGAVPAIGAQTDAIRAEFG
jgi:itaconate CoA-transferase